MSQFVNFKLNGKPAHSKPFNEFNNNEFGSEKGFTQCEELTLGVLIHQEAGNTFGQREWEQCTATFTDPVLYTLATKYLVENTQLECETITAMSDPKGGNLGEIQVMKAVMSGVKITAASTKSTSGTGGKKTIQTISWKFDQISYETKDPVTTGQAAFADTVKKVTGKP